MTLQVPGRGGDAGGEVEVAVRPDGLRLALLEVGLINSAVLRLSYMVKIAI